MKCPKCYGKVNKMVKKCQECGFRLSDLNNAVNKPVKEYKRNGRHDEILYSTVIPKDVSKKSMLIFCGIFGVFGVHNYMVGKVLKGVVQSVISAVFLLYCAFNTILVNYFAITGPVVGAVAFLIYVWEFTSIIFNFYKYPVVIQDGADI